MPRSTSGNRSAKRGKPTRIRRTISKEAAQLLDAHAADKDADKLLTQLVLTADESQWKAVKEALAEPPIFPDEKPIIL